MLRKESKTTRAAENRMDKLIKKRKEQFHKKVKHG